MTQAGQSAYLVAGKQRGCLPRLSRVMSTRGGSVVPVARSRRTFFCRFCPVPMAPFFLHPLLTQLKGSLS